MKKNNAVFYSRKLIKNILLLKYRNRIIIALLFFVLSIFQSEILSQPLAEGKDKFLGSCVRNTIRANFSKYFNQVTPENSGKWESVEYSKDQYNWTALDMAYNYAVNNGFKYKHHTLVWGQQQPSWINSLSTSEQRAQIEEWFKLVGERYPKMNQVDVVNEPIHAPPDGLSGRANYKEALGGNGSTGWDWIITSFQLARKYLPGSVELILNEYNILHSNTNTTLYLRIIDSLKVRGLIDGIGVQGHYFELRGYQPSVLQSNLNRLVETGLPVYITELDIDEADDTAQLNSYRTYFPIFWDNPGVKGITLWGYMIYEVWKPYAFLIDERNAERPALQWLRNFILGPKIPTVVSPNLVIDQPRNPILIWRTSPSAVSYKVQVSINSVFSSTLIDTSVADTTVQLKTLEANTRYFWRVSATNAKGTSDYSTVASFITGDKIVSVNEFDNLPNEYKLLQNYPNPFNPSTTISFKLPQKNFIRLQLIDLLGKIVMNISEGEYEAGTHNIKLNVPHLSSGIYFYQLTAGNFAQVKKLILLK
ncbi:MAG: endo-1,4-beta-xylanase [Bacteroidota bacterium]